MFESDVQGAHEAIPHTLSKRFKARCIYLSKGELAPSNADQIRKIRRILEELSLTTATPDDARSMLQTKGPAYTAF